jgi:nicotinamidase-related amidase
MTSKAIRDPVQDHLLTPQNSTFVIFDCQSALVDSIGSMDRQLLVNNITAAARAAVSFALPIVHSTVNMTNGASRLAIPQLRKILDRFPTYHRTTINPWEDAEFSQSVDKIGREKLIMVGLWTEASLTFAALDALTAGYEVYVVVGAVGGTSLVAHEMALRRVEQAGGRLISLSQFLCELQRDWGRKETLSAFINLLVESGGAAGMKFS